MVKKILFSWPVASATTKSTYLQLVITSRQRCFNLPRASVEHETRDDWMVWRWKATTKEQRAEDEWTHWPALWFGILEKGLGGSAGGCLWYSGGLAGLSWKSPGYVTDFLVGRAKVDFIEGSWEQTPLSIEDLNSTVAKHRRGKIKIKLPQTSPKDGSEKVELEFSVLGFQTMRRRGFRQLRAFNHSGPFYQHRPDWATLSAEEQFDGTFPFSFFFLLLLQCWAGWWLLHDHISGLTARFTTLLAHSQQTMRSYQALSAGGQCHLDLKVKMKKKKSQNKYWNFNQEFLLSAVLASCTVKTSSIGAVTVPQPLYYWKSQKRKFSYFRI